MPFATSLPMSSAVMFNSSRAESGFLLACKVDCHLQVICTGWTLWTL